MPVLSRHGQVVAALNVGAGRDGQRRGVKRESPRPASAARRWTCRYSYSAVCGFVTVARLRQIPAGQQQKHDLRCRQHQTVRLVKAAFAAAISAFRHPGG